MSNDVNQNIIESLHDEVLEMSVEEFAEYLKDLGYEYVLNDLIKKVVVGKFEKLEGGGDDI